MPYRVDVTRPPEDALDRLIALGALDVEPTDAGVSALMPDATTPEQVAVALDVPYVRASPALGRDEDSVWLLAPRTTTVAGVSLVPAALASAPGTVRLIDGPAFGTGHHPTTALCLEAVRDAVDVIRPERMLDVGTGSGVLALAALAMGIPHAVGLDIDHEAIAAATANARLNGMSPRLRLICGGPSSVRGRWPLVVANVLAAPLIEMAPTVTARVAGGGRLVLSGIPIGVADDVERAYVRLGMRRGVPHTRDGWTALVLHPSW